MTNGEKLEQVFPDGICPFFKSWLDYEYKEPLTKINQDLTKNKSEIPTSSTTKNDLVVDCVSRQFMYELGATCIATRNENGNLMALGAIEELPSVAPIRLKGRWIETAEEYYKAINEKGGGVNEDTDYFVDDIACSECLAKFSVIDNEAERFDFCPCCGSDNR
jgi:hypothetical protein